MVGSMSSKLQKESGTMIARCGSVPSAHNSKSVESVPRGTSAKAVEALGGRLGTHDMVVTVHVHSDSAASRVLFLSKRRGALSEKMTTKEIRRRNPYPDMVLAEGGLSLPGPIIARGWLRG